MSSTNRSALRRESDYYLTPLLEVENLLNQLEKDLNINFKSDALEILDPCAGGSSTDPMVYTQALEQRGGSAISLDIREDSPALLQGSFLDYDKGGYDLIISNPPFDHAMEFIEHALELTQETGYVVFLLRLNFLESKKRKEFFENHMPIAIYVHHKRMSFTKDNKTDSICHAHFVWQKGYYPEFSKLKVI